MTLAERLMSRVEFDPNGGCWLWSGHALPAGYGSMKVDGKWMLTHRLSWMIENGPIPQGVLVRHKCDVPACVNPTHLLAGTNSDNVRDCIGRGRFTPNKRRPNLKPAQIAFIREKVAEGWPDQRIATALGITRHGVGNRRRRDVREGLGQ